VIYDASPQGVFAGGQATIAKALGRDLRSVKRAVAVLLREGFAVERRRGPGQPAVLALHPSAAVFAAAERVAQKRLAPGGFPLVSPSVALAVARTRRPDGSLFVPPPYVLELMTPAEVEACTLAVATGSERLCEDQAVSEALVRLFQRRAAHERHRRSEWARIAMRVSVLNDQERAA
jgi:hypothetical protein